MFGTTDTDSGDLDHPTATQDDINYLLHYLNHYFSVGLTADKIISVYAGYRPLLRARSSQHSTAALSRTHAVLQNSSRLVTIVGGKLTTYRRIAQDTVDVLARRDAAKAKFHPTRNLPLSGSANWPTARRDLEVKGSALGIDPHTIAHLGESYGSLALSLLSLVESDAVLGQRLVVDLPYI